MHRQVYDSLVAEFSAVKKTAKGANTGWKDFLFEKQNGSHTLPKELEEVIRIELQSSQIGNFRKRN
ncbi:MAG TPA: hypothetical protein VE130_16355 [Nitrososphaeraceae archaeon]|nr:hypothetical protein [Nitrososphaeraceae archaeon]